MGAVFLKIIRSDRKRVFGISCEIMMRPQPPCQPSSCQWVATYHLVHGETWPREFRLPGTLEIDDSGRFPLLPPLSPAWPPTKPWFHLFRPRSSPSPLPLLYFKVAISDMSNDNISCQEKINVFANRIRLWLGWWWDALFLHLLSSLFYSSGSLNNRGGQVGTVTIINRNDFFSPQWCFQTRIVICIVISNNILL